MRSAAIRHDRLDGHGRAVEADGACYEGGFDAGKRSGHGTMLYAGGDVYIGQWRRDMKHGRGTYRYAGGEVEVGRYEENKNADGACKMTDGQTVWRKQDGKAVGKISLEEARAIAARVGVPAPF